jgi:ABC-2 type transport system ATP-binding protein
MHRPRLLILDEPTAGVDIELRLELWQYIQRINQEGTTILLTTHYLEEADQLASQLAIVDRGEIVAEGSPEQLKAELRGDAINVELDSEGGGSAVEAALARVDGVREVVLEGRVLRARADQGARAVPAVLAALETEGVSVAAVTVARASLDDVYLRHTGRTFSQAEDASEPELTTAGGR